MTKADVLSAREEIAACDRYKIGEVESKEVPYDLNSEFEPLHRSLPGWQEDITKIEHPDQLPANLKAYIAYLEKELEVPMTYLSVGPGRKQFFRMG